MANISLLGYAEPPRPVPVPGQRNGAGRPKFEDREKQPDPDVPYRLNKYSIPAVLALALASAVFAQDFNATVSAEQGINEDAAESQQRVSEVARQTDELLSRYRSVIRETESLRIYNDNLERLVGDQNDEIASIDRQLASLESTHRGVVPLMLEMIDTLERIVAADIPFRLEARQARVQRLRAMMGQSEVTASEKYRLVMEAYRGELEFGRTTEAYSGTLPTSGQTVEFLRVGRTLLLYQSSDQSVTGWFNPRSRRYETIEGDRYRLEVKNGLAIARNEKAPDLVILPAPGPEAAQ